MRMLLFFMLAVLLSAAGCSAHKEQVGKELRRQARDMGVIIPRDVVPPPYVIESFTGVNAGMVSGNLVGHFSRASADPYLLVSEVLSGRPTAGAHGYAPSEGVRAIIEKVSVQPDPVRLGDYLNINIRYALLTPAHDNWMRITETREIFFNEELVGKPVARLSLPDGTYTTTVRIRLPAEAPAGEYLVVASIQTDYGLDAEELRFNISELE
ncbi:MAG: hypothetical protein C4520_01810 [Candidatus Abyssobacteria bacterium SURF_5]|uniref:Intracellular proteinase inhibitor BsuPI domain-containing protein n=1 Tax=Abyssobacteria bacterium (strain SURF_5) TaxID=2093360 RepID=A0A3A4PCT5_ABYX5|nr:MAG: hypothetical protein C4520_01810 [Candidatus Abyssubacteria bacterium SURF_5]